MIQIKAEQLKKYRESKLLKTTTIILGLVFISYLPGVFYAGLRQFFPSFSATTCMLINSFFNPIIYCRRNKG